MSEIARLMAALAPKSGTFATVIPGIRIFRADSYRSRRPMYYWQGIMIVGQGRKRLFIEDNVLEYNPQQPLVMTVPMPVECETFASADEPTLVMMVDIDAQQLSHVIHQLSQHYRLPVTQDMSRQPGVFLTQNSELLNCCIERLLCALQSPLEAAVLGDGIVQELLFRILLSENAAPLYALASAHSRLARIDKALQFMHRHYSDTVEVEHLAELVNMSSSAFHRCFREVTASSPIQYLKKLRLNRARELLLQGARVKQAAAGVGYESAAQFSREFKRYFNQSPGNYARTPEEFQ
ncbi:AraC family transcriptional regulator [Shewanella fodinae]|jgi:AraC-like DNA-binding protein|uniref:AraC family transcriptional regulator n=1 Tax=Shewanella fodinae TaxID=552357 RepID=UPI0016749BB1|nr:AraC family transcriptional regulator [Shewanella fodinae]MCL2906145.1 AraC family transcriptional regulator [Shewanella fodinae]GGY98745.1 XRE family transcriptional regulator [Shewanella fodinae]